MWVLVKINSNGRGHGNEGTRSYGTIELYGTEESDISGFSYTDGACFLFFS